VCGEKQSLKQIFFHGSSKDCRHYVQQSNMNQRKQTFDNEEKLQQIIMLSDESNHDEDEGSQQPFQNGMCVGIAAWRKKGQEYI